MADVFLSYKSEDRAAGKVFADTLALEGVSVWWDPILRTGETYDEVIERNLREAAIVVVLWSPRSVKSKWVRAEATIGERKGGLMPVLIEACDRPIAFELVQTADLCGWAGDRGDVRWLDFLGDLRNALSTRAAEVRAHTAPPPPDPLTIETLFWTSIKDGNDAADFEAYLQRYPHGHFVEVARGRVRKKADADGVAKMPSTSMRFTSVTPSEPNYFGREPISKNRDDAFGLALWSWLSFAATFVVGELLGSMHESWFEGRGNIYMWAFTAFVYFARILALFFAARYSFEAIIVHKR